MFLVGIGRWGRSAGRAGRRWDGGSALDGVPVLTAVGAHPLVGVAEVCAVLILVGTADQLGQPRELCGVGVNLELFPRRR